MEYPAFNGQAWFGGGLGIGSLALLGNGAERLCGKKKKGLGITEIVTGALMGCGAGFLGYKHYKMGDDTIATNTHSRTKFGFMGPPK